jgi:cbb3-type cytochrome oxidase subunit 3
MIKDVLQSIEHVEIFPIISLLLFFAAFITMIFYAFRMDKEKLNRYSRLPLEDSVSYRRIPVPQNDMNEHGGE